MMLKQTPQLLAIVLVLLALACASARAQQQTPAAETPNEPATGAITGQVVNERGEPMPGATVFVRLIGQPNAGRAASADAEGKFSLTGLEPGLYTVSGYSPAYVTQIPETEGAPRFYRIGDSARIEMTKGGVITGTVTNALGEPVVGIRVRAFRVRDVKGNASRVLQYGSIERPTDDRGIYRIYGLNPGTYVVSAGGGPGNQSYQLNPYEGEVATFAPSSSRDGATEFNVRSGEEVTADIRYRSDPGHTVSGTVKVAGANAASIALIPADGGYMPAGNTTQPPGARGFEINGVGDGDYQIVAMEVPINAGMTTTIPDLSISEPKRITVKGADASGIELIPRPPASISGRIALEPSKAPECQGKRQPLFAETMINLQRHEKDPAAAPVFRMSPSALVPDPKGGFAFRNLQPGRYRLHPQFYARYWYLQSISIGAPPATAAAKTAPAKTDAAATWTALKSGDQISNVTITLAEGAASIRGKVPVGEGASVASGTAVYLVPAEADKVGDVLRYFISEVSSDGAFMFNSLPPGRYWSVLQSPVQTEIATLAKLRSPESAEARTKLRRVAETQKSDIALKPCQTLNDYVLSVK